MVLFEDYSPSYLVVLVLLLLNNSRGINGHSTILLIDILKTGRVHVTSLSL